MKKTQKQLDQDSLKIINNCQNEDELACVLLGWAVVKFTEKFGEPNIHADGWESFLGEALEELRLAKANYKGKSCQ